MDIVGQFRDIWKLKVTNTSNAVFRLHGKFSVAIFLVFAVLVSAKQYFGDPIDCFVSNPNNKVSIDKYCWIIGTYTSKKGFTGEVRSSKKCGDILWRFPGKLDEMLGMGLAVAKEDRYNQKYYQWVVFVFILQAIMFFLPSYLWSVWEAGRLDMLCENLCKREVILSNSHFWELSCFQLRPWLQIIGTIKDVPTSSNTCWATIDGST